MEISNEEESDSDVEIVEEKFVRPSVLNPFMKTSSPALFSVTNHKKDHVISSHFKEVEGRQSGVKSLNEQGSSRQINLNFTEQNVDRVLKINSCQLTNSFTSVNKMNLNLNNDQRNENRIQTNQHSFVSDSSMHSKTKKELKEEPSSDSDLGFNISPDYVRQLSNLKHITFVCSSNNSNIKEGTFAEGTPERRINKGIQNQVAENVQKSDSLPISCTLKSVNSSISKAFVEPNSMTIPLEPSVVHFNNQVVNACSVPSKKLKKTNLQGQASVKSHHGEKGKFSLNSSSKTVKDLEGNKFVISGYSNGQIVENIPSVKHLVPNGRSISKKNQHRKQSRNSNNVKVKNAESQQSSLCETESQNNIFNVLNMENILDSKKVSGDSVILKIPSPRKINPKVIKDMEKLMCKNGASKRHITSSSKSANKKGKLVSNNSQSSRITDSFTSSSCNIASVQSSFTKHDGKLSLKNVSNCIQKTKKKINNKSISNKKIKSSQTVTLNALPRSANGDTDSCGYRKSNELILSKKSNLLESTKCMSERRMDPFFVKLQPRKDLFESNNDGKNFHLDTISIFNSDVKNTQLNDSSMCNNNNISNSDKQQSGTLKNNISGEVNFINPSNSLNDGLNCAPEIFLDSEDIKDIKIIVENIESKKVNNCDEINNVEVNHSKKIQKESVNKKGKSGRGKHKAILNTEILCLIIKKAINYVREANERYLFSENEIKVLNHFLVLSKTAQSLYCGLLSSKCRWRRKGSMKYPGLVNIDEDLTALSDANLVHLDNMANADLNEILSRLNIMELKNIFKIQHRLVPNGDKNQLIESLLNLKSDRGFSVEGTSAIVRWNAMDILGDCVVVNEEPRNAVFKCMRFMTYSYNYENNDAFYSYLLERSSEKYQFPIYDYKPVKVFYSRENYEVYEKALFLQNKMNTLKDNKSGQMIKYLIEAKENFVKIIQDSSKMKLVASMPDFMQKYTAGNVYGRCISSNLDKAFNKNNIKDSVEFYEVLLHQTVFLVSKRGIWYLKLINLLFHQLKNYEKVCTYFQKAQQDKSVNLVAKNALNDLADSIKLSKTVPEGLKQVLDDFKVGLVLIDVGRPETIEVRSVPSTNQKSRKMYYALSGHRTDELCSPEDIALNYFNSQGFPKGFHDKGNCLIEILLSCFWDIIYGHPNYESNYISVFMNIFQEEPADWLSISFYQRRKSQIEKRLEEMSSGGYNYIINLITKCCCENENVRSVIKWMYLSKAKLSVIKEFVECMSTKFIVNASHHLLKDYRAFSSGCPDLTLWNPSEKKSIFIKVKGPEDSLAYNHKLWIRNVKNFGGDATICFIVDTAPVHLKRGISENGSGGKKRKKLPTDDSQNL